MSRAANDCEGGKGKYGNSEIGLKSLRLFGRVTERRSCWLLTIVGSVVWYVILSLYGVLSVIDFDGYGDVVLKFISESFTTWVALLYSRFYFLCWFNELIKSNCLSDDVAGWWDDNWKHKTSTVLRITSLLYNNWQFFFDFFSIKRWIQRVKLKRKVLKGNGMNCNFNEKCCFLKSL